MKEKEEMRERIAEGDKLPPFTLVNDQGKTINIYDITNHKMVIFFYPKDHSMICTREACKFRDSFREFQDNGAEVIGVSNDDPASHKQFASRHELPFQLFTDRNGMAKKTLGIKPYLFGLLGSRITIVTDEHHVIRKIIDSPFSANKHVEMALEFVKKTH